jgi:FKBP-type peptidyl-prolyl cis-trans isomerase FkpA
MRKIVIPLIIFFVVINSCIKKDSATTCNYNPCASTAPANEVMQLETYLTNTGVTTAVKHCSGMYYLVDSAGTGAAANACSYISVYYKGMLTSGTVFDSATVAPVSLPLATLIDGWKTGVPLIKKGGGIKLYIPPSLGYGAVDQKDSAGNVIIPANSILIFKIRLADVQ